MSRAAHLRQAFESAQARESELWTALVLVASAAATGFAALVLSSLIWSLAPRRAWAGQLAVLLIGFVTLLALFLLYALEQRRLLRTARAELVGQMVLREAAEREALLDPLTAAYNRRYLEHVLAREAHRADRLQCPMSLVMIDVDDFRTVNDRFGHLEGDRLLREVAGVLLSTFRRSDTVVRYGGDEFLVLLPGASAEQAARAIARVTQRVEEWNRTRREAGYCMSLSCGMATYAAGTDIVAVLDAADRGMYAEKRRAKAIA